jgi:hypothetical protein
MFDVAPEETIELARVAGLQAALCVATPSIQQTNRNSGVTWTRLAFRKRITLTKSICDGH